MTSIPILVLIFLGAVLGSFTTALTHRILNNQPWAYSKEKNLNRSCCPKCLTKLGGVDLIPLFSWLIQRGRCRHCKQTISLFYPATELISILVTLGLYYVFGLTPYLGLFLFLLPFIIAQIIVFSRGGGFSKQLFLIMISIIFWYLAVIFYII
jgi:prepilin signal peptidase PulO-like enzyme (type II secretory pathway)